MARPKIHGDRATFTVRLPRELLDAVGVAAVDAKVSKNDLVVAFIEDMLLDGPHHPVVTNPGKEQPQTPLTTETRFSVQVSDCKHPLGHSVRKGQSQMCPSCGHVR